MRQFTSFAHFNTWVMLALVAVINALAVAPAFGNGAETITSFSGSTSGGVVTATNSGSGAALYGITGTTPGGQAILGIANGTGASFGIHGLVYGPSSTGLFGEAKSTDATHPSVGLLGTSLSGNGVMGQTNVNAPSPSAAKAGVLGVDAASSTSFNAGVAGSSTRGFGMVGASSACATCPFAAGVLGQDKGIGNDGVQGISGSGYGVEGDSASSIGVFAQGGSNIQPALYVNGGGVGSTASTSAPLIIVHFRGNAQTCNGLANPRNDVMSVDQHGNMTLCGTLVANTQPLVVTRTTTGALLTSYAARKTAPTIEDDGQGQLTSGQAYVRIDSAFAAAIDQHTNYLVFITPEGDNKGLYVMQKSLSGFIVRESQGGRSTLLFNYRIVAKPADSNGLRLSPLSPIMATGANLIRREGAKQQRYLPSLRYSGGPLGSPPR